MKVNGKIEGIRDSYLEVLEKVYEIETLQNELISGEILDIIVSMTDVLQREISVFVNRRGRVMDVSIGDSNTVDLPSLDFRRGDRRLSGVRCIHTHPNGSGKLSSVDTSALVDQRLDLMAAVGVNEGKCGNIYIGLLTPELRELGDSYIIKGPIYKDSLKNMDIIDEIKNIEKGINTSTPEDTESHREERVLLVGLELPNNKGSNEDLMDELEELAKTAGGKVMEKILQRREKPDVACYIGSGKAHEIRLLCQSHGIDTVIFDDELSGAQVRNLEDIMGVKVIDRTVLILDIFASRAQTREGKLQVELAQLKYALPRLIGLGTVLSRTGGGIGTRGPGETKLEVDRRHIRERIKDLEAQLNEVKKNRSIQREKRSSGMVPVVSLVGYTNSGKSTLRNRMYDVYQPDASIKKEDVLEADMLFATLDPTTRLIRLNNGREFLVSDTVGFIRKLPHDLVDAFRATLEEVVYSDLLIHVVDASSQNADEQIKAVNSVLEKLGAIKHTDKNQTKDTSKPIIIALNKIDKVENRDDLPIYPNNMDDVVYISAKSGEGIENLMDLLEERLYNKIKSVKFNIPYDKMSIKSAIYDDCVISSEEYNEDHVTLIGEADEIAYNKYIDYIEK
mgnify:FL=1|jgi:GTP-binding protein HflX